MGSITLGSFQMSGSTRRSLDPTRLLFDLQQANEIAQSFSDCRHADEIARRVTDGLVEKFDCAFARLWLLEADQTVLRLVASSGLYTHLDGFFSRVPMGAFKVGKIAQNRVSFLSNQLADEPWVGNREWAIANQIRGFAGYPLTIKDRVVGVLAVFSHQAMAPEFLEVLQTLCTMVTVALDTAIRFERDQSTGLPMNRWGGMLSDHLAMLLSATRMTLVGTERPLPFPLTYSLLEVGRVLNEFGCAYCRLTYGEAAVELEALAPRTAGADTHGLQPLNLALTDIQFALTCWGGQLQIQATPDQRAIQILMRVPYPQAAGRDRVRVVCQWPLVQRAFSQLAIQAGLTLWPGDDEEVPLLTDNPAFVSASVIWIDTGLHPLPKGIRAKVDCSATPDDLRHAIAAMKQGDCWQVDPVSEAPQVLSDRELEIMTLLTQGHRDRDIAEHLVISESTVKFHVNNVLKKLKAQTRYQALHHVMAQGWIH